MRRLEGGSQHVVDADDAYDDLRMILRRSRAAVWRYKWLALAIVAVSGLAAFAIRGRFAPVYEVEGKVWISQEVQAQRGPVRGAALLPSSSWGDLLASYTVLGKTVRELHLYVRPSDPHNNVLFVGAGVREVVRPGVYTVTVDDATKRYSLSTTKGADDIVIERGAIGDSIGRTVGLEWAPDTARLLSAAAVTFSLSTPRQAAQQLRDRVRSVVPREGNVMHVYVTGSEAWLATRTLNSLLRHLVETAGEFKRRNLTEIRDALDTQLAYAGNALKSADDALERFRMETVTLPSETGTPINGGIAITRNPAITNFFTQKVALENAIQQRSTLEQTLSDIRSGKLDVPALWQVLPTDVGSQEIGSLLQEYTRREAELRNTLLTFTEDYQGVKDARLALAQLKDREIPRTVMSLVEQLRRRETALQAQINTGSASLRDIPARTIEEVRLTRNMEARGQLYTMLQSRYEEAHLAELSVEPDLAVLDSAGMPEFPIMNRGRQFGLMFILGGFGAAILLAIVLDRMDKRIRYTHELTRQLSLNILGAVPHAAQGGTRNSLNVLHIVESFRSLRLNLSYAAAADGPLTLTITSAGAGEGKSLVSANLALSFAGGGYRTVLIDGDLRRGSLHQTFATDRRPGLVDYLSGAVPLANCMRSTSEPRLSLLPSGSRVSTAPELLTSESFRQLITQLRADFDVILIDSPPLAVGMDPHALCVSTENVLFVVRLAQTDGEMARRRLESLERLPVRVVGAVVNDVRPSAGFNEEYSYLPGYSIREELETVVTSEGTSLESNGSASERQARFNYRAWAR
jgi:polysaccharide biosynthesis transport protein